MERNTKKGGYPLSRHAVWRNTGKCASGTLCQECPFLAEGEGTVYTEKARASRRCTGTTKDGSPCRAYALWGGTLCVVHARPGPRGPQRGRWEPPPPRKSGAVCHCVAYAWPHRPGGGLCCWPDEPEYRRTTPAGTHSLWRRP